MLIRVSTLFLALFLSASQAHAQASDATFKIMRVAYISASFADLASTEYRLRQGGVREAWLGAGLEHRPIVFGALKVGLLTATVHLVNTLHRTRPKLARFVLIGAMSAEIWATSHNLRLKVPR